MRKLLSAIAVGVGLSVGLSGSALAAGAVQQVTNPTNDPYANCTVGAGTGLNYVRSEAEPFGSVNPSDPSNIVAAVQQDRWSNGGAHGLVAGVRKNSSWSVVALPFSACASGTPTELQYERASDPWVSFGPGTPASPSSGATAYTVSISFNQSPGKNGNTVGAAVSYDGGSTWAHAQSLRSDSQTGVPVPVPDSNFQYFHDKESVTADPVHPGTAYVVWDVLIGPNMSVEADLHSVSFTDITLFSKTRDFGQTWSPVRAININANPTPQNNQTIGNVIVVDPRNDTLYDFFNQIFHTGSNAGGNPNGAHGFNVAFQKSTDGGSNWTASQLISPLLTIGVSDPNNVNPVTGAPPAPFRTGDILPEPGIDPETGYLYVVWQDSRFSGFDEVAISTSQDGGATWSTPKRVNSPGGQAFTASVAVKDSGKLGKAGTVGVTYYQLGATVLGSEPTTYLIKEFGASEITSSNSHSLDSMGASTVAGPFNQLDAPFARGYFTGDYEGLATTGSGAGASFVPVFVQGACGMSLDCRALKSVVPPTDRTPTGNDSTDLYVGTGF